MAVGGYPFAELSPRRGPGEQEALAAVAARRESSPAQGRKELRLFSLAVGLGQS